MVITSRILSIFLLLPAFLHAQTMPRERQADSSNVQKVMSWEREMAKPKEGVILPEFEGLTMSGMPFTMNRLRQHVSLVVFWYPSCGCFSPQVLEPFTQFLSNPRFQIVSIMPDSFNYTTFIREHPVPGIHVNLNSHAKCSELSLKSPYPSVMLVDATGRTLKVSNSFHKGYFDEAEWTARIREALLF